MRKLRSAGAWAWAAAVVTAAGGCTPRGVDLRHEMEAYAPAARIRAIKAVAAERAVQHIPGLVDRLDDEDVAVRMAAIVALEELTGERFAYDAWGSPADRITSVNAWRTYVATKTHRQRIQPQPPSVPPS